MATLSRGLTFGSTETVTNAKLHALVDNATITGITNADVANDAGIAGSKIDIDTTGNVLITGTQTITGAKTFSATTAMAGVSTTGLTVNGDMTVTGTVTMPDVDLETNVTGVLPIANGGTGQNTAQLAINALTDVSAATNEHVYTKDTATGNAKFKASQGISSIATAGSVLVASADTSRSTTASSTKLKEILIPVSGTLRIAFDFVYSSGVAKTIQVYRNGSAVGTAWSLNSNITKTEDIAGWSIGDLVQLYTSGGTESSISKFRIYVTTPTVYFVNID